MSVTTQQIEQLLDEKVRPELMSHEGNVQILSYEAPILKIRLTGRCAGCPSAQLTTEEVIRTAVMQAFDEIQDVVLVNEVSPELLDFARKLLNHQTGL